MRQTLELYRDDARLIRTNTNSSGNVTFNLDSNTYTVTMHKTGYYFANQTLTVDGVESVAYEAADNNYYVESINGTYNTTTGELSFNIVQGADAVLDIPFLNIKKRFTVPAETLYKISDII